MGFLASRSTKTRGSGLTSMSRRPLTGINLGMPSLKTRSVSEAMNAGLVLETKVIRHARWVINKMVDH